MPETAFGALPLWRLAVITCCAMRSMATQHITDTLGAHRVLGGSQEK